jgi:predicted dehydrogenase
VARKTKPIRLGIIGLGRAGWGMHCRELEGKEHLFRIVAASDPVAEKRDRFAARYPDARVYATAEELVADRNVEMVSVASRSLDHVPHAIMAMEAGKMVFQEKPIAVDYAEALRLKAAVKRLRGKLWVRHNRRNELPFLHIREIMASGVLGDVFEVKLRRTGFARRDDWQTIRGCGGGQMLNWGPHIVDHLLIMLDSPLKSLWKDLKCVTAAGDAEDHLKLVATGKSGRVVDVEISGAAAIGEPEYLIWGSRGALKCAGDDITVRYLDPRRKLPPRSPNRGDPGAGFGSPDKLVWVEKTFKAAPKVTWDIWEELYAAVRDRKKFPVTLDQAVEVMHTISMAKSGTPFERVPGRGRAKK